MRMTDSSSSSSHVLMHAPSAEELQPIEDGNDDVQTGSIKRVEVTFHPGYGRFLVKDKNFTQQFNNLYNQRLRLLEKDTKQAAQHRWPDVPICSQVVRIKKGEKCVVVGTTYKSMVLRPSVLAEYQAERGLCKAVLVPQGNYTATSDFIFIEDWSGRIALKGAALNPSCMCSGMVIAVVGALGDDGIFITDGWTFPLPCPSPSPSPSLSVSNGTTTKGDKGKGGNRYVLLVSGLLAGGGGNPATLDLLFDYAAGYLGGPEDQSAVSSKITRVILCGDSIARPSPEQEDVSRRNALASQRQSQVAAAMKAFDSKLALLASSLPVDVMPGALDPANYTLPQQPIHQCTLPSATQFNTCNRVTNPYEATIGGRVFLGTSGQPLDDLSKYMVDQDVQALLSSEGSSSRGGSGDSHEEQKGEGGGEGGGEEGEKAVAEGGASDKYTAMEIEAVGATVEARAAAIQAFKSSKNDDLPPSSDRKSPWCLRLLELTLKCRHMAPSAPDTLGCYPFADTDPFVIEDCPDVYFAGNQPCFATSLVTLQRPQGAKSGGSGGGGASRGSATVAERSVRLVCLPVFSLSGGAALVDLDTLECTPFTIHEPVFDMEDEE